MGSAMRRTLSRLLLALLLLPNVVHAGWLSTSAAAVSPSSILVSWGWWEDPAYPTGHPEWVGYDVYRRPLAACGPWVRVTTESVPRTFGQSQQASYLDVTPASVTTYEYRVHLVDASRNDVIFGPPECMWPCNPPAYAMCPALSAPILVGHVIDWGWGVHIESCGSECPAAGFVDNPFADALRPYAGTGQAVAIYGTTACGMTEGCAIQLDHFALADCGVTPAQRRTWGALKSIYR